MTPIAAHYALQTQKLIMSQQLLVMVYFSAFHLVMFNGIIFWGASPHSINIFRLQKRKLTMITNIRKKVLCCKLFSNLKILTLQTQYIFLLLRFVCNNKDRYIWNLDIHGRNTRYGSDFHYPTSNLTVYHTSTYYMGLKGFNSLPSYIKDKIQDIKQFRQLIKNFLYCNTFYTLDEYFNYNKKKTHYDDF